MATSVMARPLEVCGTIKHLSPDEPKRPPRVGRGPLRYRPHVDSAPRITDRRQTRRQNRSSSRLR